MDIGIYGLGRMGGNMVTRLMRGGHRVVAGNRSPGPVDEKKAEGAVGAYSIEEMVKALTSPRVLWAMVPAGEATDHTLIRNAASSRLPVVLDEDWGPGRPASRVAFVIDHPTLRTVVTIATNPCRRANIQ